MIKGFDLGVYGVVSEGTELTVIVPGHPKPFTGELVDTENKGGGTAIYLNNDGHTAIFMLDKIAGLIMPAPEEEDDTMASSSVAYYKGLSGREEEKFLGLPPESFGDHGKPFGKSILDRMYKDIVMPKGMMTTSADIPPAWQHVHDEIEVAKAKEEVADLSQRVLNEQLLRATVATLGMDKDHVKQVREALGPKQEPN